MIWQSIPNAIHQALHEGLCHMKSIKKKACKWVWSNFSDDHKKQRKEYAEQNNAHIVEYRRGYYRRNAELIKIKVKDWQNKNRKMLNSQLKLKRESNQQFKLKTDLRTRLRQAIKSNRKSGSAVRDLGCSIEYLKAYLEGQFEPGMTWDNWAHDGWHIDHIRPLASFDLTDPEQFKQAVHYTNLQPLWAKDNFKKGRR